ncbi:MAG TPA: hypothetical protein VN687_04050 [Blastocatellia bacterium]|nr:hypothetical protein [Blastocatellia bacterium]
MKRVISEHKLPGNEARNADEQGWALLGLLLALGIMSIMLVSTVVPNVQMAVQRDKEVEMIYRGEQMAAGIARYYNPGYRGGPLPGIQLQAPPPYGYLTELSKLKDGVMLGAQERKFVRASAMIDPMTSSEWEPVRLSDPRIGKFLRAFEAETLVIIPPSYRWLAGPPQTSVFKRLDPIQPGLAPPTGDVEGQPTPPNLINPPQQGRPPARPNADADTDNDDDTNNDPLGHLRSDDQPGHSNYPIVGVAPKRKGTATRPYYGLDQYEDWIFLYIPKVTTMQPNPTRGPGGRPILPGGPGGRPVTPGDNN